MRLLSTTPTRVVVHRKFAVFVVGLALLGAALACNAASGDSTPAETATPQDQGTPEVCGNGVCAGAETSVTCPADCAAGPTVTAATTGPSTPRVKVTTELNVRAGPSPNCDKVGVFAEGLEVDVLAKNPDGSWWQVPYGNGVGWISVAFTSPITDVSGVPSLQGPFCAPPPTSTYTPLPPTATNTPAPPTLTPTTAAVCGNNVVEAGEQCDGAGTCNVGFCNNSCTCQVLILSLQPIAVCGNGVKEAGEACDPPGQVCGSSGGFPPTFKVCTASCTCP